jgi:hypothetical protein
VDRISKSASSARHCPVRLRAWRGRARLWLADNLRKSRRPSCQRGSLFTLVFISVVCCANPGIGVVQYPIDHESRDLRFRQSRHFRGGGAPQIVEREIPRLRRDGGAGGDTDSNDQKPYLRRLVWKASRQPSRNSPTRPATVSLSIASMCSGGYFPCGIAESLWSPYCRRATASWLPVPRKLRMRHIYPSAPDRGGVRHPA